MKLKSYWLPIDREHAYIYIYVTFPLKFCLLFAEVFFFFFYFYFYFDRVESRRFRGTLVVGFETHAKNEPFDLLTDEKLHIVLRYLILIKWVVTVRVKGTKYRKNIFFLSWLHFILIHSCLEKFILINFVTLLHLFIYRFILCRI